MHLFRPLLQKVFMHEITLLLLEILIKWISLVELKWCIIIITCILVLTLWLSYYWLIIGSFLLVHLHFLLFACSILGHFDDPLLPIIPFNSEFGRVPLRLLLLFYHFFQIFLYSHYLLIYIFFPWRLETIVHIFELIRAFDLEIIF